MRLRPSGSQDQRLDRKNSTVRWLEGSAAMLVRSRLVVIGTEDLIRFFGWLALRMTVVQVAGAV